jgi:uncharacterized RDD family membrane protein YckC/DNA-directed RNA polymerase subunit RPC12/RpoP
MAINFSCSQCQKALFAQDQFAGRKIRCPDCQSIQLVPEPADVPKVLEPDPALKLEESPEEKAPEPAPEVSAVLENAGMIRCVKCQKAIPEKALYCRYCHAFFDPAMKAVVDGVRNEKPKEPEYASFGLRLAAFLIDWTLFLLLWSGMSTITGLAAYAIYSGKIYIGVKVASGFWLALVYMLSLGLPLLFFSILHCWGGGQTIGKWWLGIRVVRRDNGDSMGILLAFARAFGATLSLSMLGLGNAALFFDRKKRALQDFICDTVVVKD